MSDDPKDPTHEDLSEDWREAHGFVDAHEVPPVPLTLACARCGRAFAPDEPADVLCPGCRAVIGEAFP